MREGGGRGRGREGGGREGGGRVDVRKRMVKRGSNRGRWYNCR